MKNRNLIFAITALFLTICLVFINIQTTNNTHNSDQNNNNQNNTTDGSLLEIGFDRSERTPKKKRKQKENNKKDEYVSIKKGETYEEQ